MASVTVVDERAPIVVPEQTLVDRFPLGSFVAWNGPSEDGKPKRAIVVEHTDDTLVLLNGPDRVTVTGDELTTVVVLARSADAYAQRVSAKARALAKSNGWCDVGERAIEELNATPEEAARRESVRVVVTTVGHYELMPTRYNDARTPEQMLEVLRSRYYAGHGEFNHDYFRSVGATATAHDVTLRVVDAFPVAETPDVEVKNGKRKR